MKFYLLSIFLCFSSISFANTSFSFLKKNAEIDKLTDDIFLIKNNGGNIALNVGEQGLLMVDNGNPEEAKELRKAIETLGGDKPLKYIINTHWHYDHSGGNNLLGESATIIAHDNVRKYLSEPQTIPLFKLSHEAYKQQGLPTITYPQQTNIHFNDHTIELIYFANGHSDSDTLVYFTEANVVHMGDLMVYPMYPFIDFNSNGNAINYANNIGKILTIINDETIVIPGHGVVTNKQGMKDFHTMLTGTIAEVTALRAQGLSEDEIIERGLSDRWEKWKHSAIKENTWIEEIYLSLDLLEQSN